MSPSLDYRVEPVNPQAHIFSVTLSVHAPLAEGETLRLPAWIPGSYMIREFSRNIVEIKAWQAARPVLLEKIDKHTWKTGPLASTAPLQVETLVYAWDLSVRCAHLDQSHGFFNGTQLFLSVVGRENTPHQVEICRPEGAAYSTWRVATTLPVAPGKGVDEHGFGVRLAADYDELIDHPVEMGSFESLGFMVSGVPHRMVITGRGRFDLQRLSADLQKVCSAVARLFGDSLPFDQYLFLVMAVGDGYGGLEHRASSALICARNDLPAFGEESIDDAYRGFLGLCSHEYFHAWHIKRIKPRAFIPYKLYEENYTRLLWVFEGFTSYYDDLALIRAGLISAKEYLGLIAKTISAVERNSGRLKQSLADSSFDAWTKYYRQDENSPNAIVSYYQKGALVALGLDLTIRLKSDGRFSLDDVMRHLWKHYGRSVGGVPEEAMPQIIHAATGVDVGKDIAAWVMGHADVPLDRLFKAFGVVVAKKTGSRASGLGIRVKADGSILRVSAVLDGGSGQFAGLSAGDELVAVNELRVTATNFEKLLMRCQTGELLGVTVFRRDELRSYEVMLNPHRVEERELSFRSRLSARTRALLGDWLQADTPHEG
jgi:predicted metalloprotease with PDZ domain